MFTDTPDPILASLTDTARTNFARMTLGEISFVLTGFAVGRGGYNSTNPVHITPIVTSLSALEDQFFPLTGVKILESIETPYPQTIIANCRLGRDDAVSALGEIGIWAEIIYSAVNPGEVGTSFLLGVSHFPIMTKTLRQAILYRVIIQF
jgi:hypothetical protein